MARQLFVAMLVLYIACAAAWVISAGVVREGSEVELLNVACDPTVELWRDLNAKFIIKYEKDTGTRVSVRQSHGGSASQARLVIDGLESDVVTLALWSDTDAIRKAGYIDEGWEAKLPNRSLPFTSTIVFVVRKGNPKAIHDWCDLILDDVSIITPNPKTSGNGKWSFLAAWGAVLHRGGNDAEALDFVTKLYKRVPVLDSGARGATLTFAQKKIGDVHLTWENEAYAEVLEAKGELEIVYPSASVLAEPHVAVVDAVVRRKGTRVVAEAFLNFAYTEEAQEVLAKYRYRPTNAVIWAKHAEEFPKISLFQFTLIGPNWDEIQARFFARNGVYDQLFSAGR